MRWEGFINKLGKIFEMRFGHVGWIFDSKAAVLCVE